MFDKECFLYVARCLDRDIKFLRATYMEQAIMNVQTSPKSCTAMCRNTLEALTTDLYKQNGQTAPNNLFERMNFDENELNRANQYVKDKKIRELLHHVRIFGNAGAHDKDDFYVDMYDAYGVVQNTFHILNWYAEKYENNPCLLDKILSSYHMNVRNISNSMDIKMSSLSLDSGKLDQFTAAITPESAETNEEFNETKYNNDNGIAQEERYGSETSLLKIEYQFIPFRKVELLNQDNASAAAWKIRKVAAPVLEKLDKVFVKPENYEGVYNQLSRNNLLILCNDQPVGKYSMAIRLLSDRYPVVDGSFAIYEFELSEGGSLRDLEYIKLESNAGYIINDYNNAIEYKTLENIISWLKGINSAIIIIQSVKSPSNMDYRLTSYYISCSKPKDFAKMVDNHVWYYAKTEELYSNIMCSSNEEINSLLLSNYTFPFESNQVAEKVVDVGDFQLLKNETILQLIFPNRIKSDVELWFLDEHRTLDDIAALLTLCIYREIEFELFFELSQSIREAIAPIFKFTNVEVERTESEAIQYVFQNSVDRMLDSIHAKVSNQNINSNVGLIPIKVVSFEAAQHGKHILEYLLNQVPTVFRPLVNWIKEHGITENSKMNRNLATTVTELMQMDFRFVINEIIQPYAKEHNYAAHYIILRALWILQEEHKEKYIKYIWTLCKNWITCDSLQLNYVAVMLFGKYFYQMYPKAVLLHYGDLVKRLVKKRVKYKILNLFLNDIFDAAKNYVRNGRADIKYIEYVISWLASWIKEEPALSGFPLIMFEVLLECEHIEYETRNYVYTLLWAMKQSEQIKQDVTYIMAIHMLNVPDARYDAVNIIDTWFDFCSTNDTNSLFFAEWFQGMRPFLKPVVVKKLESELYKRRSSNNNQQKRLALTVLKGWS